MGKLRILSIQSNRITKLEGLEGLANLEELYISHNGVQRLEGLEKNVSIIIGPPQQSNTAPSHHSILTLQLKLKTLDVGNNEIPEVENISHLSYLEELWVRDLFFS